MDTNERTLTGGTGRKSAKYGLKIVIALFGLALIMQGAFVPLPHGGTLGIESAAAAPGDTPTDASADSGTDDTPDETDIADFAAEYDRDGDGEVDEPEDEEDDEPADEPDEADDAGQDDDHDDDQEDERDEDNDGQDDRDDDDDSGDLADGREEIDGEAIPDFRISGFSRYPSDKRLRGLGEFGGLTPLIEREEALLFEN